MFLCSKIVIFINHTNVFDNDNNDSYIANQKRIVFSLYRLISRSDLEIIFQKFYWQG